MINPMRGEHSFEAGGKTYVMRYSTTALVHLEKITGRGIFDLLSELNDWTADPKKIRLGLIAEILWCSMRQTHPNITLEDASELIAAAGGGHEVLNHFSQAIMLAFPVPEVKGNGDARPTIEAELTGPPS